MKERRRKNAPKKRKRGGKNQPPAAPSSGANLPHGPPDLDFSPSPPPTALAGLPPPEPFDDEEEEGAEHASDPAPPPAAELASVPVEFPPLPAPSRFSPRQRAVGYGVLAGVLCLAGVGWFRHVPQAESSPAAPAPTPAPTAEPVPTNAPHFVDELDVTTFQKGNIHTHTRKSDGDSRPEVVIAWYRDHGYAFVALTDHNNLTDPKDYKRLERPGSFVLIPGEEVTMKGAKRQVHVNALCEKKAIGGHRDKTRAGALNWAIRQIHAQGGVALVNHPNWNWALTAKDVEEAKGAELLEIASGHPGVHQDGDETHQSHEAIWDATLDAGMHFAGVAVDDAHHFADQVPKRPAKPGRAWIQVFAEEPRQSLICDALRKGRLYASTGAEISRIQVVRDAFTVWTNDAGAEVNFVGKGGEVLQHDDQIGEDGARYEPRAGQVYVRARVTNADGKQAWTNAYFLEP